MLTEPRRVDPPVRSASDADDALRDLYAEHGQALLAYAERFTADRGRAEDIVQETFLRAWRQLPGLLDDERPVRAWLLRVARRLLIDGARAAQARPALAEHNQSTEPADDGGLSQLLDQTILIDAMQQLSPAHQQIVVETFFLGTADASDRGTTRYASRHCPLPAALRAQPTAPTTRRRPRSR
jgi:RNA polymerase sigma-70 factor (ECF subfamily)